VIFIEPLQRFGHRNFRFAAVLGLTMHAKTNALWLGAMMLSASIVPQITAAAQDDTYGTIARRNAFHLGAPKVQTAAPPRLESPRPKVLLTGVTDIGGKKRALVEILEAGKPARKAVVAEGDTVNTVQVLHIDVLRAQVKVRIAEVESSLSLGDGK